jgi:hypothetical protein
LVVFIYDKLLLAKLAGEYEVYQKIEAEKQRKAEEERKRKNLAFKNSLKRCNPSFEKLGGLFLV